MEIFHLEFKNSIKRLWCHIFGHKESSWMEEWWAIGHSTGYDVKYCLRCNTKLEKRKHLKSLYGKLNRELKKISEEWVKK